MRFRILFLLLFPALGFPGGSVDDTESPVREYLVPYIDGKIHSRDVFQKLLEVSGSSVELPEDFPNARLPVNKRVARWTVNSWNLLVGRYGVGFDLRENGVALTVNRARIEAGLDEFEETFIRFFNIDRPYTLHHLTDDGRRGPVVVLLHGLDSSRRFFSKTSAHLGEQGYDVFFFEYPNDDRILRNAKRLSRVLKELPDHRRKDISLVTVSMGGLISQTMIETPELHVEGVRRLIACVPPFQGSKLASMRFLVEIGDQTMNFLDPGRMADLFGDGMGRAGIDLHPDSLFMEKLGQMERHPNVSYSILAGNKGFVDPSALKALRENIRKAEADNGFTEALRRVALERVNLLLDFQTGKGDGAVKLTSATLEGVDDRVVLPVHHVEMLTDLTGDDPPPGLPEVLKRLPAPSGDGEMPPASTEN